MDLRFGVESLSPTVRPAELAAELVRSFPKALAELRQQNPDYANVTVEAELEQSIPLDPATVYVILKVAGSALAGGFFKKLGEDLYTLLRKRVKNGRISKPET